MFFVMYVMVLLWTTRACIVKVSVRRLMLWLMLFRCLRNGVTICGPRERRNVHNDISGTFQMAL